MHVSSRNVLVVVACPAPLEFLSRIERQSAVQDRLSHPLKNCCIFTELANSVWCETIFPAPPHQVGHAFSSRKKSKTMFSIRRTLKFSSFLVLELWEKRKFWQAWSTFWEGAGKQRFSATLGVSQSFPTSATQGGLKEHVHPVWLGSFQLIPGLVSQGRGISVPFNWPFTLLLHKY